MDYEKRLNLLSLSVMNALKDSNIDLGYIDIMENIYKEPKAPLTCSYLTLKILRYQIMHSIAHMEEKITYITTL